MTKYKCNTCGGVYFDIEPDGLLYFHACAPVFDAKGFYKERTNKRDENVGKNLVGKGRSSLD